MDYWKIITYAEGEEFETRERIVNDETYQAIREAMANGAEFIDLGEKGIIRRSSIKEILQANDIVSDYQRQGVKIDGLLEPAEKPKQIQGNVRKVGDYLKETKESFYKRMGWKLD